MGIDMWCDHSALQNEKNRKQTQEAEAARGTGPLPFRFANTAAARFISAGGCPPTHEGGSAWWPHTHTHTAAGGAIEMAE